MSAAAPWSAAALLLAISGAAQEAVPDGGRARAVHRIPLFHAEGGRIAPGDDPLLPFSTRLSCGPCHDYARVARGRHFDWGDPGAAPGRPGEPWILADRKSGTQLPLAHRPWPGTWRPEAVGLDAHLFTRAFGAHLPGGGLSEPAGLPGRFAVTGGLEIDCLHCHAAEPGRDASEWAVQVSRQNFLWAAAAASGLARVAGETTRLPDTFDPFMEGNETTRGPRVRYDPTRFDADGLVLLDLTRRPDPSRCFACHSFQELGPGQPPTWNRDPDVHLAAGLACTDCHRNDLDHGILRGCPEEAGPTAAAAGGSLTCKGCHLGEPAARGGRLGAPRPAHRGLPALHLERIACTLCHSGPRPGPRAFRSQTARSHRMGVHAGYRGEAAPPFLAAPLFLKDAQGLLAPHRGLWPAFWGRLDGTGVRPIEPLGLATLLEKCLAPRPAAEGAPEGRVDRSQVVEALGLLGGEGRAEPVYVAGGWLHRLGPDGELLRQEHPAADLVAWPLAHDVRPAAQSLGAEGCLECHGPDAPLFFGRVAAEGPLALEGQREWALHELMGCDPAYLRLSAQAWRTREWFKLLGFLCAGAIALVLLRFGLGGSRGKATGAGSGC